MFEVLKTVEIQIEILCFVHILNQTFVVLVLVAE